MLNKNKVNPIENSNQIVYIKNQITRANIIVGDYSYYSDVNLKKFEDCVTHHYEFIGDKLIIGKFCQIAEGVEFIMNGANHQLNSVTTYPFFVFGWKNSKYIKENYLIKGDTVIGNDVWIGQNSTFMPGIRVGDGVIIASNSTVVTNLKPYCVYGGNPAKFIKQRFSDEVISKLIEIKWWDLNDEIIERNIDILTDPNIDNLNKIDTSKNYEF